MERGSGQTGRARSARPYLEKRRAAGCSRYPRSAGCRTIRYALVREILFVRELQFDRVSSRCRSPPAFLLCTSALNRKQRVLIDVGVDVNGVDRDDRREDRRRAGNTADIIAFGEERAAHAAIDGRPDLGVFQVEPGRSSAASAASIALFASWNAPGERPTPPGRWPYWPAVAACGPLLAARSPTALSPARTPPGVDRTSPCASAGSIWNSTIAFLHQSAPTEISLPGCNRKLAAEFPPFSTGSIRPVNSSRSTISFCSTGATVTVGKGALPCAGFRLQPASAKAATINLRRGRRTWMHE